MTTYQCYCIYQVSQARLRDGPLTEGLLQLMRLVIESRIYATSKLEYFATKEFKTIDRELDSIFESPQAELRFRKEGHQQSKACLYRSTGFLSCRNIGIFDIHELFVSAHDQRFIYLNYEGKTYSVSHSSAIDGYRQALCDYLQKDGRNMRALRKKLSSSHPELFAPTKIKKLKLTPRIVNCRSEVFNAISHKHEEIAVVFGSPTSGMEDIVENILDIMPSKVLRVFLHDLQTNNLDCEAIANRLLQKAADTLSKDRSIMLPTTFVFYQVESYNWRQLNIISYIQEYLERHNITTAKVALLTNNIVCATKLCALMPAQFVHVPEATLDEKAFLDGVTKQNKAIGSKPGTRLLKFYYLKGMVRWRLNRKQTESCLQLVIDQSVASRVGQLDQQQLLMLLHLVREKQVSISELSSWAGIKRDDIFKLRDLGLIEIDCIGKTALHEYVVPKFMPHELLAALCCSGQEQVASANRYSLLPVQNQPVRIFATGLNLSYIQLGGFPKSRKSNRQSANKTSIRYSK